MNGLKTFWILMIALTMLSACVPQTKQTECQGNEAFNAILRTCVPVVGGPSSFINIDSFSPTSALTKFKNDFTSVTFSIIISNPYGQTYNVVWERIFNGVPVPLTPSTLTPNSSSYSFAPFSLSTEVGTHIITAKIVDTNNNIVDSHSFEIKINDLPKPIINTPTVTPALYHASYTPSNLPQTYSFTASNNGAIMVGAGYRTDWKIYRSGILIDSETDVFPTAAPLGSLSSNGYNYPVYTFDPVLIDGITIGAYIINARITNTANEVVAEQQWSATVSHPPLAKITNRDIYSGSTSPAFAAVTTAYNNVAYTGSPTYNFVPTGGVAQGDYCVSVSNGEGTYLGDGLFVRVDYYLDGGTLVYSNLTTAIDNKVCLTDAAVGILNSVIFSNASATSTQSHTLVARVVDERTGAEYTGTDMNASLGSYPITWNFSVKPQNQAPSVVFGTMTTVTCPTTVGTTQSGCIAPSDTLFTVKINLASDDFYTLPANEANFNYSIRLYQNGVNIQSCSKTDPGYTGATDVNGADGYDCIFSIESYNGAGPINLATQGYQIQAEISDNGSPITGSAATSSTLYWSFLPTTGVTETNTVPTLAGWSVSGAVTEGVTNGLNFSVNITDAERDNHTYAIKYCPDGPCLTPTTLTTGSITRTTNANPYALSVAYTLPEDFLLNLTALGCHTKKRNQTCAVNFFITVTDVPNTAVPLTATSGVLPSTITNANPAPVLNTTASNPVPLAFSGAPSYAFVGHPISIINNPSSILTDASNVAAEKTYRYQWFVRNSSSASAYTAIEGATSNNLVWTPSYIKELNIAADNPLYIMLCVEDQPAAAVPTVNIVDSTCSDVLPLAAPWTVTVRNNISVTHDLSIMTSPSELALVGTDKGIETAVWYEAPSTHNAVTSSASYIAMIDNNKRINVKKVLVTSTGGIDKINSSLIASFNAFPGVTVVDTVKNLSITGTGNSLYVAYLASESGSPASFFPQVRRISISTGKLVPNNHQGIFGFDYDGLDILESCTPVATCLVTKNATNTTIQFAPSGGTYGGNFVIDSPAGAYSIDFVAPVDSDSICSTCTQTATATQLRDLINTSTDPRLAGYYATLVGVDTVAIWGSAQNDYFNAATDPVAAPMIAGQIGKIYISGVNWYLPFINKSLGGAYIDNLSVYSGAIGNNMASSPESLIIPTALSGLETIGAVTQFDNGLDSLGNYWVAVVRTSGSAGRLYKVDPTAYSVVGPYSILSGEALLSVRLGASTTNVFVGSQTALGPIKLSVFDNNGASLAQFAINNLPNVDPLSDTEDYFNDTAMSSYRIIPYGTEARIFAISNGGAADYKLYVARLRSVAGTWTISCGDCKPASQLVRNLSPFVSLGVASIRAKPLATDPLYRLSSDGGVTNQGIKDVAFVSFGQFENPAGGCDPAIGVFNVEGESIGSSTIFTGANPNEDGGLFRSPFIKN